MFRLSNLSVLAGFMYWCTEVLFVFSISWPCLLALSVWRLLWVWRLALWLRGNIHLGDNQADLSRSFVNKAIRGAKQYHGISLITSVSTKDDLNYCSLLIKIMEMVHSGGRALPYLHISEICRPIPPSAFWLCFISFPYIVHYLIYSDHFV